MNEAQVEEKVFLSSKDVGHVEIEDRFDEMREFLLLYNSAIKEVKTKLEILDEEFKIKRKRNPIEYMKSRIKTPKSIMSKLERKGFEVDIDSAKNNLYDIAGVRVICSFVDDIYEVANTLIKQDDIILIEEKDYIKNPKPNGYRSLHLVVQVPVFFSKHVELVPVEVQIRTIAMDFWASLEHKLYYKTEKNGSLHIKQDLKECADIISSTDLRMQEIQKQVECLE
ncbi:MAG: GTP pyrophosphokinase family protein [Clostridium butyricum]|nr:GTP pyrophosphokinase family protein [Clostridium butyricum]